MESAIRCLSMLLMSPGESYSAQIFPSLPMSVARGVDLQGN